MPTPDIEHMREIAREALRLSHEIGELGDDLLEVANDNLSPVDVSLSALSSAEAFVREHKAFLERM